jgi:pyridoxine kinase
MARVLALSSWVAAGHVGLSAAIPALQLLGHEIIGLPTITLSNHKAFPACAGAETPPDTLRAMRAALESNGWLAGLDAVLTGYLPSAAHAAFAAETIALVRAASPGARVVVDPVLGDDPKGLYLPQAAAEALRDQLAPLADALTPNRFELSWLTGEPVASVAQAAAAARRLRAPRVLLTSPPLGPGETGVCAIGAEGARLCRLPKLEGAPHGAGDVFAALIAAGLSAAEAAGALQALIAASLGRPHLALAESAASWTQAAPAPISAPAA